MDRLADRFGVGASCAAGPGRRYRDLRYRRRSPAAAGRYAMDWLTGHESGQDRLARDAHHVLGIDVTVTLVQAYRTSPASPSASNEVGSTITLPSTRQRRAGDGDGTRCHAKLVSGVDQSIAVGQTEHGIITFMSHLPSSASRRGDLRPYLQLHRDGADLTSRSCGPAAAARLTRAAQRRPCERYWTNPPTNRFGGFGHPVLQVADTTAHHGRSPMADQNRARPKNRGRNSSRLTSPNDDRDNRVLGLTATDRVSCRATLSRPSLVAAPAGSHERLTSRAVAGGRHRTRPGWGEAAALVSP